MSDRGYRYFATPDPLDDSKISFWYEPDRGRDKGKIKPWPPQRNKWGKLTWKDVRAAVGDNASTEKQREYVRQWFKNVRFEREVVAACLSEPEFAELAAARFSRYCIRCCNCGKALTEERSVTYGIGPECRHGASPGFLSALMERVKRVYAEAELSKP